MKNETKQTDKSNKNQLFIGATVQPIQNCELLASSEDTTLFINKRSLIIMNLTLQTLKSCLIEDQKILSATYYSNLQVFVVNTDKYILTVNKQAQIVSKQRIPQLLQAKSLIILNMEDGYQGVPFQRKDQMLFFTNEYLFQVQILIKYQRSLLKTKSLCAFKIQFVDKPIIVHYEWTANYIQLQKIKLLICWNQSQTYVFETPQKLHQKIQLTYIFDKIMKRNKAYDSDNKINAFQASIKNRLLIAAFQLGSIKIYRLDQTKKYISQLRGHQRQCTSLLIPKQNPDLLYSCGLDNCIRIWDLMDFGQVYHVRFQIICSKVQMLNQKLIFAQSIESRRAFFVKLNIGLLKPLLSQPKAGRLISLVSDGQWGISLYSNNFIQAFLLGSYNNQTRQFTQKIEFPIKYGNLRSTVKLREQTFAICLQKGFSIIKLNKNQSLNQNFQLKRLVYNHSLIAKTNEKGKLMQIIHQKLLDTYFFTILQDWKNIPIAINVTAVSFLLHTIVPKWDIDIKAKVHNNDHLHQDKQKQADYVILGNDRGYIFFVNIKRKTHFHTRVNFHSQAIQFIQQITPKNNQNLTFISTTVSNQIAIWQLSEHQIPSIYIRLTYTKDVSIIKPVKSYLAIGCKSGQFNIFEIDLKNKEIQFLQNDSFKEEGHLKNIIAIDYIEYQGNSIWLTGGEDYAIKMWKGIQKQLIFQVRVFGLINYAIFAKRDIDIIMSHGENGQISVLASANIPQLEECRYQISNKKLQYQAKQINIREFFCPQKEMSPRSPRRREKQIQKFSKQLSNTKKVESDQLIKLRSIERKLESNLYLNSERKSLAKTQQKVSKRHTPTKQFNQNLSTSIVLPKINTKQIYLNESDNRYKQYKNIPQDTLYKIQSSRLKSYSYAGRIS